MVNGIINVLKPVGMTSSAVVYWLRRKLETKKVGHTGTLDPGAAGVLPVCVGQATRLAEYLSGQGKEYRAEIVLGLSTTTQDNYGRVVQDLPAGHLGREDFLQLIPRFAGEIRQIPPMYSAVRQGGKHLYEYARAGMEVERQPRTVFIHELKLLEWMAGEKPRAIIDISCSKGTYIRTLCHDIGEALGCGAYMSYLLRTRSGPFRIAESFTLEEIDRCLQLKSDSFLLPLSAGLELPRVELPAERVNAFKSGLSTYWQPENGNPVFVGLKEGDHVQVYAGEILLGIGIWQRGEIYPHKVL